MAGIKEFLWLWGDGFMLWWSHKINGYTIWSDDNRLIMISSEKKGTLGSADGVGG